MTNDALSLRRVRPSDCRLLWEWANEPTVRQASFTTAEIPYETHQAWFHGKLGDPNCRFYLLCEENEPVAQVRYDRDGDSAVVSISVAESHRRKGYALQALTRSEADVLKCWPAVALVALVRSDNAASRVVFENAGYTKTGEERIHGFEAVKYLKGARR